MHDSPTTFKQGAEPQPMGQDTDAQAYRAGIYGLLAALLRDTPDADMLSQVADLDDGQNKGKNELQLAFSMLALAARHSGESALRDEYHALFIGLGRGELVPFGSWYQTGFLMERPLGLLREDLNRLGFERATDVREPEDHIAAVCEVMAYLIQEGRDSGVQRRFFDQHVDSWAERFFQDLTDAKSSVFYRSVGRLGCAYVQLERHYLSLPD